MQQPIGANTNYRYYFQVDAFGPRQKVRANPRPTSLTMLKMPIRGDSTPQSIRTNTDLNRHA